MSFDYNKPIEQLTKQAAGSLAGFLTKGFLRPMFGWTTTDTGKFLKWVAKNRGAAGTFNKRTGHWFRTPLDQISGKRSAWQKSMDYLAAAGDKLEGLETNLRHSLNKDYVDLLQSGKYSKNTLDNLRKAMPIVGTGYLVGGPLLGKDNPLSWGAYPANYAFQYATPLGLAFQGGEKVYNGVMQKGFDTAYDASMMTAKSMAEGLQQKGRLAHLYGLLSPEGLSNKLKQTAIEGINDQFGTYAQQLGLKHPMDRFTKS